MSFASDIKFIVSLINEHATVEGDATRDAITEALSYFKDIINTVLEYGTGVEEDIIDLKELITSIF